MLHICYSSEFIIWKRLEKNKLKDLTNRTKEYYDNKAI